MTPLVIAGYDGGGRGRDAIVLARDLALAIDAELLVVAALTYRPEVLGVEAYQRAERADAARLQIQADRVCGRGRAETLAVPSTSAAKTLAEVAERECADLIAIGSSEHAPFGRVMPGDVWQSLLATGSCGVAIAPRNYSDVSSGRPKKIGAGYTGSQRSLAVVDQAARLADTAEGHLRLVSVFGGREGGGERGMRALELQLAKALERIGSDVAATGEALAGKPAEKLVELSAELDLLVLGAPKESALEHPLLGEVSSGLIRAAECPVLVLPRPSDVTIKRRRFSPASPHRSADGAGQVR